jgi:hypothetical protein
VNEGSAATPALCISARHEAKRSFGRKCKGLTGAPVNKRCAVSVGTGKAPEERSARHEAKRSFGRNGQSAGGTFRPTRSEAQFRSERAKRRRNVPPDTKRSAVSVGTGKAPEAHAKCRITGQRAPGKIAWLRLMLHNWLS